MCNKEEIYIKHLKSLGNRLKRLRLAKGYTSYELFAYDHKISRSQYGRYEKGHNISFKTLIKIVEIQGLSIKEFFSEGFDIV